MPRLEGCRLWGLAECDEAGPYPIIATCFKRLHTWRVPRSSYITLRRNK